MQIRYTTSVQASVKRTGKWVEIQRKSGGQKLSENKKKNLVKIITSFILNYFSRANRSIR